MDQGTKLEKIVKDLFQTLDTQFNASQYSQDSYKSQFLPQLKQTSPVIINGNPIGGKHAFQETWLKFPLTQHNITSLDYHPIPGTGTSVVNLSGKVRFEQSGKTRLGENADLQQLQQANLGIPTTPSALAKRFIWGSWLGFNANLIIDDQIFNTLNSESINSLNWKIIYKPEDSLIGI